MEKKKCKICNHYFLPDKFHPYQDICSYCRKEIRKRYKREYDKEWRKKHPEYYKQYHKDYRKKYGRL